MAAVDRILGEFGYFFAPLRRGVHNGDQLVDLLNRFGYDIAPDVTDVAVAGFRDLFDALTDVGQAIASLPDSPAIDDLATLGPPIRAAFAEVRHMASAGAAAAALSIDESFFDELLDALLHEYLNRRAPVAIPLLEALGVIQYRELAASISGRQLDCTIVVFDWDPLGLFVTDTGAWAEQTYGWGVDFDTSRAIPALLHVIEEIGPPKGYVEIMTPNQVDAFVTNHPPPLPPPRIGYAPIIYESTDNPDDTITVDSEAGLAIVPCGDTAAPANFGFAIAPYSAGAVPASFPTIVDQLEIVGEIAAAAVGGAMLAVQPSGLSLVGGAAVDASFELAVKYSNGDNTPITVIGASDSTRIQIYGALAVVGGNLRGDLFIAAGVEGLRLLIDPSEDGFLGAVISSPIEIDGGDLLIGWRPGRGVYFEGGTSLSVALPLNLDLGPVKIHEFGLGLDWEDNLALTTTVSGEVSLGPLFAAVEGLGLRIQLVENTVDGQLGNHDLVFGLVVPNGYAVNLDGGVVSGGGLLSINGSEYRGALALEVVSFGVSAFAILNNELPNGDDGFSFVASIFGTFTLPLGFGFFLTGVGGIVGINRTIDTDALRSVLFSGRFDNLLFPEDPIQNATAILDDMASVFPAREGQHIFGPIAKIGWGQPVLVEVTLGVVIEVGGAPRILILGGLECLLPTKAAALVELRLQFFGEIDFGRELISFDATLEGSRVLTFAISGEIALRSGWAPRVDHVMSFGGLHPAYPKPSNLPNLRRLSINFGTNNPRITLQGYQAITLNSLQFGASASLYAKGPKIGRRRLAAEGNVYFDALIYFNPFGFDISLGGSLSLLVNGKEQLGLGFDLRLRGPNTFTINGKVWAKIFGIKVKFSIEHTWGPSRSLSRPVVEPTELLIKALNDSNGFEVIAASSRSPGVTFRSPVEGDPGGLDPFGGLRFVQRALPLGVEISKVGEANVANGPAVFDLVVVDGDDDGTTVDDAHIDFVRGHFWSLTAAERLRTPAFERHKAGVEIVADDGLVVDDAVSIDEIYNYEVVVIEASDQNTNVSRVQKAPPLDVTFLERWKHLGVTQVAVPKNRRRISAVDAPKVRTTGYTSFPSHIDTAGATSQPDPGSQSLAGAHLQTTGVYASYVVAASRG